METAALSPKTVRLRDPFHSLREGIPLAGRWVESEPARQKLSGTVTSLQSVVIVVLYVILHEHSPICTGFTSSSEIMEFITTIDNTTTKGAGR